jgi:hypothetical protein
MIPVTSPAYAAVDRETIWAALFVWFQQKVGSSFKVMGRKHVAPPQLATADQPAFFLVATKEKHIPQQKGMPTLLVLRGYIILYAFDDSPLEAIGKEQLLGETQLNKLLQAVDGALVPDDPSSGKFTLNGKVTHCWLEGESDLDPGIFGPQAAAILPINILV